MMQAIEEMQNKTDIRKLMELLDEFGVIYEVIDLREHMPDTSNVHVAFMLVDGLNIKQGAVIFDFKRETGEFLTIKGRCESARK